MAKLMISITHAQDNADKATVGFVVANAGVASGVETVVFLSSEGAFLAQAGNADDMHEPGFRPLRELIASFVENGGKIWVCSPCFRRRGLDESRLTTGTTIVGGAKAVEFLAQGASCMSY